MNSGLVQLNTKHITYNDGGGSRPHDAIVGAHAVLLGARRLNLLPTRIHTKRHRKTMSETIPQTPSKQARKIFLGFYTAIKRAANHLKRDRPLGLVGDPEGAGDLLVELDWARQEIARYQEKKIQTKKQEHPAKF